MVVHSVFLYTLCGANVGRHKNSKLCVCVWRERGEEGREGGREGERDGNVFMHVCDLFKTSCFSWRLKCW